MTDVDIDPFGDHDKTKSRPEEPTGENIPLTPGGGSTWEPEREQETSFEGESQRTRHLKTMLKICIMCYLKSMREPQKHFILMISTSEMGNCTT